MKILNCLLLVLLGVLCMAQVPDYTFNPNLSPVKYGIGDFLEDGHGNHRAVVEVTNPASAVYAHIEWRRHDSDPSAKGVIVQNSKGETVNSIAFNVTDPTGDVIFEAKDSGNYYIYYLPYYQNKSYAIEKTEYIDPVCKADPAWLSANNLDTELPDLSKYPVATQTEIQARNEFNSFYPMEVPATDEEVQKMTEGVTAPYMVFAEDRLFQIKMKRNVPYKWFKSGEVTTFTGTAQPNEINTFQIGIYALEDINNLKVEASDFGSIKAENIHCINMGGKDYLGRPFTKTVDIKKGFIQPLWFYVQMPRDAQGSYEGKITIKSEGNADRVVDVKIDIQGEILENGGVDDLWRMSRLAWLDSDLGINDDLVKPYTPIKVSGDKASVLNRDFYFDKLGFPTQLTSNKNKILTAPMSFIVKINNKPVEFTVKDSKVLVQNQGAYEFEITSTCGALDLIVHGRLEFDGVLEYGVRLTANEDTTYNATLSSPLSSEVVKYAMGLGFRGGAAPNTYYYEWNPNRVDYAIWMGDYDAGVQIYLKQSDDQFRTAGVVDPSVFNKGWYNDNKGTGMLKREGKTYLSEFYSGEKTLKAGESCDYDFRVTVTPFKPLDNKYYSYRVGNASDKHANIYHLHHATGPNPYINYPFAKYDDLRRFTESIKGIPIGLSKSLEYDVKGLMTGQTGSITVWCSSNFDWTSETNKTFIDIHFDTTELFNFYWNRDVKTFRCVMWEDVPNTVAYSNDFGMPSWKPDEIHKVTISWGDKFLVYIDDELKGECNFAGIGHDTPLKFTLGSDFTYYGVKVSGDSLSSDFDIYNPSAEGNNIIIFDTFREYDDTGFISQVGPKGIWTGSKPTITKENNLNKVNLTSKDDFKDMDINLYYTCRELTDHCFEIWALRSLGDEIYDSQTLLYTGEGAKIIGDESTGYQWLYEHLQTDYVPGWHCNLGEDDCAAIATKYISRWMNYYVNGMDYIMKSLGIGGLYLDGIGYDRQTMKRIARVMEANNPDYRINFHAGNCYDYLDLKASTFNMNLEHFAYLNSLWTGEMYDFDNTKPNYWFVEMSGIPFGLRNEILDYNTGGNPWRGMVFAMSGRGMPCNDAIFQMWDDTDIANRTMIGYWDKKPVVKTNNPLVYATAYTKKDSVLVCVGSWDKDSIVDINVDYKACGINPKKCTIKTVPIQGLQEERELTSLKGIEIPEAKGIIFLIENK